MEKIVVIASQIDDTIKNSLEKAKNIDLEILDSNNLPENMECSLAIIDLPEQEANNVITKISSTIPLLLCLNDEAATIKSNTHDIDIIFKPLKAKELEVRIKNLLKFKALKEELGKISICDELTGLYNRKYLLNRLDEEMSRSRRHSIPLTCIFMDIDYFKVVNDIYGYEAGDEVLKKVSELMKNHLRKEDILTRYGDEEFLIALPNTTDTNAYILAERIRKDVKSYKFFDEEEPMNVTISGGISTYPFPHMQPEVNTLIRYAEHALYNAKKQGKNKVVMFSQINFDV